MPRYIDFYKNLDEDSKLRVELPIPDVVKEITRLNYGAHRFLSALVHELRAKQKEYRDSSDLKHVIEEESPLADGIEELLNKGYYY